MDLDGLASFSTKRSITAFVHTLERKGVGFSYERRLGQHHICGNNAVSAVKTSAGQFSRIVSM